MPHVTSPPNPLPRQLPAGTRWSVSYSEDTVHWFRLLLPSAKRDAGLWLPTLFVNEARPLEVVAAKANTLAVNAHCIDWSSYYEAITLPRIQEFGEDALGEPPFVLPTRLPTGTEWSFGGKSFRVLGTSRLCEGAWVPLTYLNLEIDAVQVVPGPPIDPALVNWQSFYRAQAVTEGALVRGLCTAGGFVWGTLREYDCVDVAGRVRSYSLVSGKHEERGVHTDWCVFTDTLRLVPQPGDLWLTTNAEQVGILGHDSPRHRFVCSLERGARVAEFCLDDFVYRARKNPATEAATAALPPAPTESPAPAPDEAADRLKAEQKAAWYRREDEAHAAQLAALREDAPRLRTGGRHSRLVPLGHPPAWPSQGDDEP